MNESPAPTVSTTSTGSAGTCTEPVRLNAWAPPPPSVTTTSRVRPDASRWAATSAGVLSGANAWTSSSLIFTRSACAATSVMSCQACGAGGRNTGRALGS